MNRSSLNRVVITTTVLWNSTVVIQIAETVRKTSVAMVGAEIIPVETKSASIVVLIVSTTITAIKGVLIMKNAESKKDKLERILNCYGITWEELSELNISQINAIETDYYNRYGENISIMFNFKQLHNV